MDFSTIARSLAVGSLSGFTSGLTGLSAGGGLIIFSTVLLGADQHLAQGISLIAQVPPTSLSAVKRYRQNGNRAPLQWIVCIASGMLIFGPIGAFVAGLVSSTLLKWAFVGYLCLSAVWLILKREPKAVATETSSTPPRLWQLLIVGTVAGFSSGFLGIGGGLAITVGLVACLNIRQLQAQAVSLVVLMIPTTLPAAAVYISEGKAPSWLSVAAIIIGLYIGTDLGARIANRLAPKTMKVVVITYVFMMASYMTYLALK